MASDVSNDGYSLDISPAAQRDLRRLKKTAHVDDLAMIMEGIEYVADAPHCYGSKKLTNQEIYRYRVGNYRILYGIDEPNKKIEIARIRDRKDVYKD